MTEYWVSKQSYFCKYCDIYIRDDAPSRAQHENGLRHKGNLERYIRDIYKREERAQKERADEANQVSRINEAARLAHQEKDLIGGTSGSTQLKQEEKSETEGDEGIEIRKRMKYNKQDWKGAENLENYSDARSLGLVDADAELEATAILEEEKELRSKEGRVGQWEAVIKLPSIQKDKINSNSSNHQEKLVSKLSNNRDPDKKPNRKLFTERSTLENDSDEEALHSMEIKVKVDRRLQASKLESDDTPGLTLHGSIQPIRLDGLQEDSNESVTKDDPGSTFPPVIQNNIVDDEQDIKPKTEQLEVSPPTIMFKKRKLKNSQPRQKI